LLLPYFKVFEMVGWWWSF